MARPAPRKNRPDKTQLAFLGPEAAECHRPLEPNVFTRPHRVCAPWAWAGRPGRWPRTAYHSILGLNDRKSMKFTGLMACTAH